MADATLTASCHEDHLCCTRHLNSISVVDLIQGGPFGEGQGVPEGRGAADRLMGFGGKRLQGQFAWYEYWTHFVG